MDMKLYEMHASVCSALGNAKRLQIIDFLRNGEKSAGILSKQIGIPKANLSQHLQVMKSNGLLESRREGVSIYYRIANPKIITACELMREVLMEQIEDISRLRA